MINHFPQASSHNWIAYSYLPSILSVSLPLPPLWVIEFWWRNAYLLKLYPNDSFIHPAWIDENGTLSKVITEQCEVTSVFETEFVAKSRPKQLLQLSKSDATRCIRFVFQPFSRRDLLSLFGFTKNRPRKDDVSTRSVCFRITLLPLPHFCLANPK